ncbi:MAG: DUF3644 domain-containing protein [Candidatus Thermoplasmatota archaeon]|jgi:hypothetical protein|nr:DUF3644 domain-containing protein [Candidatus Thermoplasmatota archaeon]
MAELQKVETETTTNIEEILEKSKSSAISAIQNFNNPLSEFRYENFIVQIVIAWNALLQSILLKKNQNIYEKDSKSEYILVDGRKKTISVERLSNIFFNNNDDPVFRNLEFIIKLRNEIEHSLYTNISAWKIDIFGECQSCLINYDSLIKEEFGDHAGITDKMYLAIQLSKSFVKEQVETQTKQAREAELSIKQLIESYRDNISIEMYNDLRYRFSIFIIPKVSNNKHADDIPVLFNNDIKIDPEEIKGKFGLLTVKTTQIEVPTQRSYKLKPKEIVEQVKIMTGRYDFKIYLHTNCWRKYKARPRDKKNNFKNEFCLFDEAHRDYVYTQKWVDFLVQKLKKDIEYESIQKRSYQEPKVSKNNLH